jgi:DNA repair protein RadC
MAEVKETEYLSHSTENLRWIKRVETKLVHDGKFEYYGKPLNTGTELASVFRRLAESDREQAVVLFLDHLSNPIGYDLWLGSIDSVSVDPRRVINIAASVMASQIAICHNHPTGPALPSGGDEMFAMQIAQVCKIMGFRLLDFLIVNSEGYFSFQEVSHPAMLLGFIPVVLL